MTSPDQERWLRVKEKLRAEVGEDIFQSWFARMDLERIEVNTAHLSVPTRFLKSWIQSHYTDRVLACWQGENTDIQKIDVSVLALPAGQDAVGVVRLNPTLEKPRRYRQMRGVGIDPLQVHAGKPALKYIFANFSAKLLLDL